MNKENKFEELDSLHEKHCELITYIDEFCQKHNLQWCLAYGSALGAQRHGGPIPWDDDADIYMMAKDYEKFRSAFMSEGDQDRFYLQELNMIDGMISTPKLRMNGTTFIEKSLKDFDIHHGIYVDIFLLHESPQTFLGKVFGIVATMYLTLKRLSNYNYKKRKSVSLLLWFLRQFPRDFGVGLAYKQLYKWDNLETEQIVDWELYSGKPRWFLDKKDIFPAKRINYSGYSFNVPKNNTKYLKVAYGDWRTLPSLDKMKWNQHSAEWSVTQDFRDKTKNVIYFKDEHL